MILSSVIAGLAVVLSAVILRKVQQVHVLVNSRLDTALEQIKDLKEQRQKREDELKREK